MHNNLFFSFKLVFLVLLFPVLLEAQIATTTNANGLDFCTAVDLLVHSSIQNFESIKGPALTEVGDDSLLNSLLNDKFYSLVVLPNSNLCAIRKSPNDTIGYYFDATYANFYAGDSLKVMQKLDSLKKVIYVCLDAGPCDTCSPHFYTMKNILGETVNYEDIYFNRLHSGYDPELRYGYIRFEWYADKNGGFIFLQFFHQKH